MCFTTKDLLIVLTITTPSIVVIVSHLFWCLFICFAKKNNKNNHHGDFLIEMIWFDFMMLWKNVTIYCDIHDDWVLIYLFIEYYHLK